MEKIGIKYKAAKGYGWRSAWCMVVWVYADPRPALDTMGDKIKVCVWFFWVIGLFMETNNLGAKRE